MEILPRWGLSGGSLRFRPEKGRSLVCHRKPLVAIQQNRNACFPKPSSPRKGWKSPTSKPKVGPLNQSAKKCFASCCIMGWGWQPWGKHLFWVMVWAESRRNRTLHLRKQPFKRSPLDLSANDQALRIGQKVNDHPSLRRMHLDCPSKID